MINSRMGTARGLYCYDLDNRMLVPHGMEDIMPTVWIYGVVEDKNGDIWFTNRDSLCRLSPSDMTYTEFGVKDGLESDLFCIRASKKSAMRFISDVSPVLCHLILRM